MAEDSKQKAQGTRTRSAQGTTSAKGTRGTGRTSSSARGGATKARSASGAQNKTTARSHAAAPAGKKAADKNQDSRAIEQMTQAAEEQRKKAALGAPRKKQRKSAGFWIVWIIIALAVGVAIGKFCLGIVPLGVTTGKTALTENQLDSVVAVYSSGFNMHTVTAREVFENTTGLESAKSSDNYKFPSADSILDYVRNSILDDKVSQEGIEVSDDEMNQYAQDMLGTQDFDSIATTYGVSVDNAKKIVRNSAGVKKLYAKITDGKSGSDASTAWTDYVNGLLANTSIVLGETIG